MSDESVKERARIEQADRVLAIIWVAMILSVLTVAGVGFAIGPKEPGPGIDVGLMSTLFLAIGASMGVPCLVVRVLRDRALDHATDATAAVARYQQLAIVAIAMGEGIGMLGGVALLIGLPSFVASVLLPLSVGLVLVNKPAMRAAADRARMRKDLA